MNVPLPRMLRSYQQRSATWLYERDAAFLIAPLGAGKGAAALTALADLVRDEERRHGLVIAPKLVATTVWAAEITTPPEKEDYLKSLAAGLDLVDAIKDLRVALHDQAKRALENGDNVPGYALTAGRAERHWHDECAAIAALHRLGLTRDDVIAETMRSPKQVELRAKARGLKIPQELIVSHRSGTSLVRSENAHAPVRGRREIAQSFSEALEAFLEGGTYGQSSRY